MTGESAALGFPHGAESGVWIRDRSNMGLLRVLRNTYLSQYYYNKLNQTYLIVYRILTDATGRSLTTKARLSGILLDFQRHFTSGRIGSCRSESSCLAPPLSCSPHYKRVTTLIHLLRKLGAVWCEADQVQANNNNGKEGGMAVNARKMTTMATGRSQEPGTVLRGPILYRSLCTSA